MDWIDSCIKPWFSIWELLWQPYSSGIKQSRRPWKEHMRAGDKEFSPWGLPSLWNSPLENNRYIQNSATSRKHCKSFLLTSLPGLSVACEVTILFYSQLCYLYWFCGRHSTSTMTVLQNLKTEFFSVLLPPKCIHTLRFSSSIPISCEWMKTI